MEQYIGWDIDDKKTVACVMQKGKKDKFDTMRTDVAVMKRWLQKQRKPRTKLHLTFEVSGQSVTYCEPSCLTAWKPRDDRKEWIFDIDNYTILKVG